MCCLIEVGFIMVPQRGQGTMYLARSGSPPMVESSVLAAVTLVE
jgi:hypothetical protein